MLKLTQNLGHAHTDVADTLTLTLDDRIRGRFKAVTDSGREAGIFLERGHCLLHGDVLRAEDGTLVRVLAAPEDLTEATATDWLLFAKAVYHLGNRHAAMEIGSLWCRFKPDHVLEDLARHLGLTIAPITAPFQPETGAYHGGHGH
jgi:urease accessory protein